MTDSTSLWNKKQDEVTVGDSVKVAAAITAVMVVLPFAIGGAVAGAEALKNKIQERRAAKKASRK